MSIECRTGVLREGVSKVLNLVAKKNDSLPILAYSLFSGRKRLS